MTAEQATQAWISTMGPEALARSNSYFEGGYWLILIGWVVTVVSCGLLIWLQVLPKLRDGLFGKIKNGFILAFLLTVAATIALSILSFPFDVYSGFYREHQFGLATQTLPEWLSDYAIGFGINLVISALAIAGLYMIVKRAPKTWWIWGAGFTGVLMAIMIAVSPVFIAPLFNDYTPMADGPLKQDILAMAEANGVPATDVYVFDESAQSNRVTANVSGMFGTTRISLADNLINRVSPAGVRMVMAHEIGHYVLHHTVSLLVFFVLTIAIVFALLGTILNRIIGDGRWGIRAVFDPAGLPLVIVVASTLFTFATPVFNNIIRFHEHQADIFGINASREPAGFAETALLLSEYRKMQPGSVERFLFYDHPSGYDRIFMAMQWQEAQMRAGHYPQGPLGPPEGYRPDFIVVKP